MGEWMSENQCGRLIRIGLQDRFGQSGPYETLLKTYGMDRCAIADAVRRLAAE